MTVVLATVCRDGVVLGSDSQITDKGRGMTYPAEKIHPLGKLAAWGGSGARSVLFDVERCFNENSAAILEAPDIGRALQEQVLPILRHHYDTFIPDDYPAEWNDRFYAEQYLLMCYLAGGAAGDEVLLGTHHVATSPHLLDELRPFLPPIGTPLVGGGCWLTKR